MSHLLLTLTGWPKAEQSGKLSDTFSEIIICRNSSISSTQKSGMMTVMWSPTGMAAMMFLMKMLTPARTILCEASTPSPHTTLRFETWPVSWCSEDSFTIVTLASSTLQSLSTVAVHSNVKFLKNIKYWSFQSVCIYWYVVLFWLPRLVIYYYFHMRRLFLLI